MVKMLLKLRCDQQLVIVILKLLYIERIVVYQQAGQIIATSHDFTPNGGLVRDHPLISGKFRLVKYYNLARRR